MGNSGFYVALMQFRNNIQQHFSTIMVKNVFRISRNCFTARTYLASSRIREQNVLHVKI